jgi:alkylation response protein AidB-like acyl-CoA dehydrogenase
MVSADLPLPPEQALLRSTSARFVTATSPPPAVRALAEGDGCLPRAYLEAAGELGWFAMFVPEAHGGGSVSGEPLADAALIATERGRALQPGPFVPMNVVADALARHGSDAQRAEVLPALVAGRTTAAWAAADERTGWDAGRAVRWVEADHGYVLDGSATMVQDGASADWLLVTAGSARGRSQFLVKRDAPGVIVRRQGGLDVTRRFHRVDLDGVVVTAADLVGPLRRAGAAVERQLQVAAVLTAAEMVGAMEADLTLAVEYAKARVAFGRPIGSFQAVKHLLASTSLLLETSKAVCELATRAGDGRYGARMASVAKAHIGDAAVELAEHCFQVFGGVAFTWEHDHHLFQRRLTVDAMLFGHPDWHRDHLCDLYGFAEAVAR